MSKKPSDTSTQPSIVPTIYLDESIPRRIAAELRRYSEWRIEVHREHYPHDPCGDASIGDPVVIQKCGENGWVLISADDKMRIVPENCMAAALYKARIVLFARTYYTGEYLAALVAGRDKLLRFIRKSQGPYFARISRAGDMSPLPQGAANLLTRIPVETTAADAEGIGSVQG